MCLKKAQPAHLAGFAETRRAPAAHNGCSSAYKRIYSPHALTSRLTGESATIKNLLSRAAKSRPPRGRGVNG